MLQAYGLMGWRCGYIAVRYNLDILLSVLLCAQIPYAYMQILLL